MPTRFSWWELPQSVTPIAPTPINPQAQQMGQAASAMTAAQNAINAERLRSLAATTQLGYNADDWKLPTGGEWSAQNPGWGKPVEMLPMSMQQQPIAPTAPQGYVDANGVWQLPYTPPAVQPGIAPGEMPGFVQGLGKVGDVLGAPGRLLGRAIFGQDAPGYEPDAMSNTFRDIWNGKAPSWFAPPDQTIGQIEREGARDFRKQFDALQQGDIGTAVGVAANQSAISQSGAALKQFVENPSLLTGAQAMLGAAGAALPFMPKALFPLLNSPVQGVEALMGTAMSVVPDVAGPVGEALKSVATLGGLEDTLQDIPGTMTRLQKSVDEARASKKAALELANSTAQHAQEMVGLLGADKSAKYRANSGILDKPFTDDPAAWVDYQTRHIVFSGIDARKKAIERIAAGEDPSVAMRGKAGPVAGGVVFEDEKVEWQTKVTEYLSSAEAVAYQKAIKGGNTPEQAQQIAAQARAEAEDFVSGYNFIPGAEKPLAEMILQTAVSLSPLDAMNKLHIGKVFGWNALIPKARALGISEKLGRVYEASARNIEGDTMQEQLLATLRGLSPDQMRGEIKARRTLGQVEPPAGVTQPKATTWQKIGADLYLRYLGGIEYLPQSRAHIQDGYARDVVHTLTKDARSGAEAVERLTRFVNDPASLTKQYGNTPISMKAEMARPVVREALAELSKLPSVKMPKADMFAQGQPPTFRPMDFMVEAINHLKLASDRVNDVKPMRERPFHERLGSGMKMWLGEFMLRTPGYIMRNMLSDSVIMAMDGLYSFDSFENLTRYLDRFGITSDLVTGQPIGEWKASRLSRVPIVGDIQNKLGEINDKLEIGRRVRAYTTAFRQFINANYKPQIGEGARRILGDDLGVVASQLEAAFRTGASEREVREAYQRIITPRRPMDTYDIGDSLRQLNVPTDSITPEMGGRVWGDLQNTTTEAGVDRVIDKFEAAIIEQKQQRVMELGDVVNPRNSTDAIINQDAGEYGDMVRGVANRAITAGLLTPEQAEVETRQLLETLVQYEGAIRDARTVMARTIAGIPEGTDPLRVHAIVTWAMNQEYGVRDQARQKQAEIYRQTLALIESLKGIVKRDGIGIRQAWNEYRRLNDGEQRARLTEIRGVHEWANGALSRIGDWDALVRERPELATESTAADDLLQQAQDMIRQNGSEDFEAKLLGNRTKIDLARRDTYRQSQLILRYEPTLATHIFDVLTAVERDVQTAASNTVARVRLELARKDYGEIDLAEYDRRVNAHWSDYFDYADKRYGRYGQAQLLWVQVRNSQIATALRGFGYNDEQIAEFFMKATDVEGKLALDAATSEDDGTTFNEDVRLPERRNPMDEGTVPDGTPLTWREVEPGVERGVPADEQPPQTVNPMGEQNPAAPPDDIPTNTGDRQTPESVVAQDAHVEMNGDSDPFNVRTFIDHVTEQQLKALKAIRDGAKKHLCESAKATTGGKKLTDEQIKVLEEELQKNLRHLHETVEAGKTYASERGNFSLLDYGKKRGFDSWTQLIAPFSYWGTRQGKNFLLRFLSDPSILVAYWRYLEAMKKHNRNRGTRKRFETAFRIPLSGLTGGKLDDVYIDPMQAIFPFDGIFGGADDSDSQATALQELYKSASRMGFRPSPFIDVPLRLAGAMMSKQPNQEGYGEEAAQYGPGSLGKFIPQSGFVQGATAAMGMGNGMGINPEAPIRKALGIAETEAFDAYRVARSISNLAAEQNKAYGQAFDRRPFLLAQEFIQKHAKDYPTALSTMKAADVAAELGVDVQLATMAMQVAQQGAAMAAQERGLSQLGSFMGGQRLIQHPQGEYDRLQMSAQEKGAAYNPVTGQGSRAQVQAVQAANPALEVQRAQYGTIPGDDYDYRWLNDRAMTQEINAKFDQLKDQVVVMRPWDRKAGYAIEDARRDALERVDRTAAGSSTAVWTDDYKRAQAAINGANGVAQAVQPAQPLANYKPWSVAGATPQEALIVRQNEIMSQVSRTQPRTESYINAQGEIDYSAYREAVDDWRKNLAKIAKALPAMSIIMDKAKGEGNDKALTSFVSTMTGEQIDQYRWRNDTPLEAAQRTYYEAIYNPVMDAYSNLRNQGDSDAWDKTIGAVTALDGNTLAQLTNQQYKGRFTPAQLAEVQKMNFPPLADVMKLTQGPQARAKTMARDAFWKVYNEGIPPGSEAYELKQNPLVSLILDRDSRGTATTEQYEMATASMNQYVVQNYGGVQAEWTQARGEKALLDQLLTAQYGQDGPALMQSYDMAANAERQATLRAQYPALNTILMLRYRYEQGHPVYAAYYARKLGKGEQKQLGIAPSTSSGSGATNPLGVLKVKSVGR